MLYIRKFLPLVLLPLLFAGCSSITNLTPQQQTRNATGLYPVEVALASRQQTLRWETIKPSVVVGVDFYPMPPTSLMKNRWETLAPVSATTNVIYYKFKFDFEYNSIPHPRPDSKLSSEFRLMIVDK